MRGLNDEAFRYVLDQFGDRDYEFWSRLVGGDPILLPHPADSRYSIEISPIWNAEPDGTVRVLVYTTSHSLFEFVQRGRSFLVYPDGTVDTGESG